MTHLTSLLLCLSVVAGAQAAPSAVALHATKPPVIDGKLNDAIWQGPPQISNFVVLGKNTPAAQQTQAWIAYDADNLYIAVRAFDSQMSKLHATVRERDGRVFSDDVIELFFDPACTGFSMIQLAFNPLGTKTDLSGDAVGLSYAWNGRWTVKTAREANAWTAEVAIPFANFGLSKSVGREWAMNICRERPASGELSCWSQTGSKFAVPTAFGHVAVGADLKPFYIDLGVQDWGQAIIGQNTLHFSVRNPTAADHKLSASLEVTTPEGKTLASKPVALNVAPGKKLDRSVVYDLPGGGTHFLSLAVTEGGRLVAVTGRTMPVAPLAAFEIFHSFYRDDAQVRYQLNVQHRDLASYRIEAKLHALGAARILQTRTVAPPKSQVGHIMPAFDAGASLPRGQYVIDVAVTDRQGKVLDSQSLRFAQLMDRSIKSRMVTLRPSDNMLIVGGKPFFPIGIYEAPGTETYMQRLADAGFNLCHCPAASGPALKLILKSARAHGLKLWISMSSLMDFSTDAAARRAKMADIVKTVGNSPALLCWESMDEPVWGGHNADGYYDGYCFLRALDQQRPIWTNHAPRSTIAELAHWNRATDISGVDIYPVPEPQQQSSLPDKTIAVVGDECAKNVAAVDGRKPIFMVLQGFGWAELHKTPGKPTHAIMPTFHQSRFMAYDSIVHGANGILYWGTHYTKKPSRFWSELRSLVSELAALEPVLSSESLHGASAAHVVQPRSGVRLIHKRVGGHNFLLIVNETPSSVPATIAVPGLKAASLRRLFENATVPVAAGIVKLTLTGYDVAVLSDDANFRDVRKDFSADWKHPAAPTNTALLHEPGNLISNPGFEVDADGDLIPDDWSPSVPLTVSLSDDAHAGKHSLAITGLGGDLSPLVVQTSIGIELGKHYRFSAWVKAPASAQFRIYVEWHTDTYHSQCLPYTRGTGQWQQVSLPIVGNPDPRGGAYAVAQMKGTGTVLFDQLRLQETK